MRIQEQSIFSLFLTLLKVKHTRKNTEKNYAEHPHNENLYGLSHMLNQYGVTNAGFQIEPTVESLMALETPFLIQTKEGFGIVSDIGKEDVELYYLKNKVRFSFENFLHTWTGIILIAEPDEQSGEPAYKQNRRLEIIDQVKKGVLSVICLVLLLFMGYKNGIYLKPGFVFSLFLSIIGVYVCVLLLLKQLNIQSKYADKVCSLLLHSGTCNSILETDAAKLLGIVSWSEIGLGYFLGNILLLVTNPSFYPLIALLNICSLPFTLWSVWYQYKAGQWCILCLITQVILWLLFFSNLMTGLLIWPEFKIMQIIIAGCIYLLPIVAINLWAESFSQTARFTEVIQKLNNFKADDGIFANLLVGGEKYETNRNIGLLLGNPDGINMVTVISNPHCNPCARMHERIENIINNNGNNLCIQYILTSFNDELEYSTKMILAMSKKLSKEEFDRFLYDWYKEGKNNREMWYQKYLFDPESEEVNADLAKHRNWVKKAGLFSTPTILFNGYILPERYQIEDMTYFQNIEIAQQ